MNDRTEQCVSFGERLRQLRETAGLTQEQLAERAGLTAKGISALERGERRRPYTHTVQALAAALGLSEEECEALTAAARPRTGAGLPEATIQPLNTLPVPPTPLIGREQETAAVEQLLTEAPVRLITLTGPGGVGKTRLAVHLAAEVAAQFADGVVFVALAPIRDPALVVPTIAAALNLRQTADLPLRDTLQGYLQSKRMLLVLDNFEHVAEAAPEIASLLVACPLLKLLATSRASLRLRGEQEYPVKPLILPSPDKFSRLDEVKRSPAVELFTQSAQAVAPHFKLDQANAPAIAAICHRLDGLPLAIELAAARIKLLDPAALLARLDRALPLLTGGPRDLPERQQTMRQTIAWSYDLLRPEEQRLFRRLAVFSGGWTLAAAEAVCQETSQPDEVLEGLTSLLDKNLVVRMEDPLSEELRYGFLGTIRAYALEQLETTGETEQMRHRHALYYRAFAQETAPELARAEQAFWLDRLAQEHDNLQSAAGWFLSQGDAESIARLGESLWRFWYLRGLTAEGLSWVEQALALPEKLAAPARRTLTLVAGLMLHERGQMERAAAMVEEAMATAACLDELDLPTQMTIPILYGFIKLAQGELSQAKQFFGQGLAQARANDLRSLEGMSLSALAQIAIHTGDFEQAYLLLDQAEPVLRAEGALWDLTVYLNIRSMIPQIQGNYLETAQLLRESLLLSLQLRETASLVYILEGLAGALAGQGAAEKAAHLFGAAEALREMTGALGRTSTGATEIHEHYVDMVRAQLSPEQLARAWQQGRTMPLRDVITIALGR